MSKQRDDYDNPWKEAIAVYFKSFIAFFFPDIYEQIDWKIPYEFLDNELRQVMRDDELGQREADKLVKVWLTNGQETWVLIHLEVQSQYQSTFAERMYVYNSRIFGIYRKKVASLAILSDSEKSWRPQEYSYDIWGTRVLLRFSMVKLLDYQEDWQTLEASINPFAPIVMAYLKTQATGGKPQERLEWKLSIVKSLFERGYNRSEIRELFRLIDWMMTLPGDLESGFSQEIKRFEEENQMRYDTTFERLARREDIIEILEIRFTELPSELVKAINLVQDSELLRMLHRQAVTIESLSDFQQLISQSQSEENND
ncbi:transposase [[Phormidium ambiguum] IAM M-71]|uniref:Transposase n=1 Tax=[Phormidium ambiguum] IAM M-71 TaxID=454136 RepID=A0A1U7I9J6_9CYAN|nr:transposase [Phormidium ambiguum]OKH33140.1 transposase [Phormidium ambiguum IAM M-71]